MGQNSRAAKNLSTYGQVDNGIPSLLRTVRSRGTNAPSATMRKNKYNERKSPPQNRVPRRRFRSLPVARRSALAITLAVLVRGGNIVALARLVQIVRSGVSAGKNKNKKKNDY